MLLVGVRVPSSAFPTKKAFSQLLINNLKNIEKQIESSTVFIVNKVDLVDSAGIERVKKIVGAHHPAPEFYETVYAEIPLNRYMPETIKTERPAMENPEPISPRALDVFIDKLLADPKSSMTPPDRLLSVSYTWMGGGRDRFEAVVALIPDDIVRAKGIFQTVSGTCLFNYVMGRSQIEPITSTKKMTAFTDRIVFIGPPEAIEMLGRVDFGGAMQPSAATG